MVSFLLSCLVLLCIITYYEMCYIYKNLEEQHRLKVPISQSLILTATRQFVAMAKLTTAAGILCKRTHSQKE